ncbi:MAG: CBS domain-containing protein [Acidobacteriota bacterium]
MRELGLKTKPDFQFAYIDGRMRFEVAEEVKPDGAASEEASSEGASSEETSSEEASSEEVSSTSDVVPNAAVAELVGTAIGDPTYRIGKLKSANEQPTSVNPNASIEEAVTLMLLHDFSQLPVMQGERSLKGAITWQSLGSSLWLGKCCRSVQDCMTEPAVISSEASLFAAIPTIVEKGYVLVRDQQTNIISGIVTTTDLSLQFRQLAEPFLRLGEIENHLRRLSDGKFSQELLVSAKDPADVDRPVTDPKDLSLGEHIRLLENPDRWEALGLKIDRTTFVSHLNEVKKIRNAVMHFDPDPTPLKELEELRQFVRLLEAVGVANPQQDRSTT